MRNIEEIKRNNILKKQLEKLGINDIVLLQKEYLFGIETPDSNHINIISELKKSSLIMTAEVDEEIIPYDLTMLDKIAEFIHRVNFGLIIGKIELDFDNGNIVFFASVPYENVYPETKIYFRLIMTISLMVDKYLPGIISVLDGIYSPEEAYEECEKTYQSTMRS